MKNNFKLILLFCMTLVACANEGQHAIIAHKNSPIDTVIQTDTTKKSSRKVATTPANNDTLIVDKIAAVFIEPDLPKIEKQKKAIGEEEFYTGADDYLFYMSKSHEFLYSNNVIPLNAKNKKFIKFIHGDKSEEVIEIDKLPNPWNIYFFDPAKKAKQVDLTVIDEEYKSYFK